MLGKRYSSEIERKWQEYWEKHNVYAFNRQNLGKKRLYVIDSPPPFTSGALHMGHVLSYTYFDIAARYKRMRGYEVLYPQGWDAQGFPTEVKVEKRYGKLNPEEFRKKCEEWSWEMIKRMKESMIKMGFSPDWSFEYITMTPEYHKLVQESIIEMYRKGHIYRAKHPVLWCPKCKSAIAKAETEDKQEQTSLYYFNFYVDGKSIPVASTRPELLHACVALLVYPEDERYKDIVGKKAKTPFGKEVPVIAEKDVDKEFGTGAVMLCTYGDKEDVAWQKRHNLEVVDAIDEHGRMKNTPFYDGLWYKEAREKVVEYLKSKGHLIKEERIEHTIKVHDRCKHAVELIPSMEWFARVKENADKIKEMAKQIRWIPSFGIHYLTDWLDNIDWDWVISRDRIFGTPIPFYVCSKCNRIEEAEELPFYPEKAKPKDCECGGKLIPEKKVLDVWIDSSITPLVVSGWKRDDELFKHAYPTTLRPQGVEIVRTWAFYTIYRSGVVLTGKKPWDEILLNGNVLAPDGRKMSKSLGNVIDPLKLLKEYPADAIRQWAAMSGAMAKDRPFSYEDIRFAKQFLNKYWNAARFIAQTEEVEEGKPIRSVDRWILTRLSELIKEVTDALENYNYRTAVVKIQHFFWYEFADYYIEYAKYRLYSDKKQEISYVLRKVLYECNKLFAPFAPHITEEIYHVVFNAKEGESIHRTAWPSFAFEDKKAVERAKHANEIMRRIREYKARNGMAMNAELNKVIISAPIKLEDFVEDIKETGKIKEISFVEGQLALEVR